MERTLEPRHFNVKKWLTMVGVSIGIFIFALDVYVINLALPAMIESLDTNFAVIQWVVLSYLITIAVTVLSIAQLGDIWNKKHLYLIGMGIFTLASLACGLSPRVEYLIFFRALQGLGGAFLSGLGTAIIVETFPPEDRGLGMGIRSGIYGLGITLGPAIGGLLLAMGGWPLIFLINVPIGLTGVAMVALFMPDSAITSSNKQIDGLGTVILMLTLACFMAATTLIQINLINRLWIVLLAGLAVLGLLVFLWVEANQPSPLLNLHLFKSIDLSTGLALRFIGNLSIAAIIFMLPFFMELIKHYPPQESGLLLAIPPMIISVAAPLSGFISDRFDPKIISLIGLALIAGSCLFLAGLNEATSLIYYTIAVVPYALGIALFQSPNNSLIMGAVSLPYLGIASGLLSLSRILGQAVGLPLVALIFSLATLGQPQVISGTSVIAAPVSALVYGSRAAFLAVGIFLTVMTITVMLIRVYLERRSPLASQCQP